MVYRKNNQAITLPGILVSMTLISLVVTAVLQNYTVAKKYLLKIEKRLELLHNQIVADVFIRRAIVASGYKGSNSRLLVPEYSSLLAEHIVPQANFAVCLAANGNCEGLVEKKILRKISSGKIKANSDILVIYDIPHGVSLLTADMGSARSELHIDGVKNWYSGDHMMITDGGYRQRFNISSYCWQTLYHDFPENRQLDFIKPFTKGAEVFRSKHVAFYVAKNHNGGYSLYMDDFCRQDSYRRAEAIIDDVVDLKVEKNNYGWLHNKMVVVKLLLKSNLALFDKQNINWHGQVVTTDRCLHKTVTIVATAVN